MKKELVCIALVLTLSCNSKTESPPPPAKVNAVMVTSQTIPKSVYGIGSVVPYYSADLKAQVEGYLLDYYFEEGQIVQAGDLLYKIDPSPYQAQLNKAIAEKEHQVASYIYAKEKVKSYEPLLPQQYVSPLNMLEYQTSEKITQADIAQAEAQVELNTIQLNYCYIKAPFTGRVGKRLIDPGNLITNDGKTMLTITQVSPTYIDFSVPEKELYQILKYQNQSDHGLDVMIHVQGTDEVFESKLVLVDNYIDANTGMIPLRAQAPNEKALLWPNQFVKAEIILYREEALLIPHEALLLGQKGHYVYTIENNIAKIQLVEKGSVYGDMVQIVKGLSQKSQVVTAGMFRLRDGSAVQIVEAI